MNTETIYTACGKLIADFLPSRSEFRDSNGHHLQEQLTRKTGMKSNISTSNRSASRKKKQVRFSENSLLMQVSIPSSSEFHQRWYSAKDKARFKQTLFRDIRRVNAIIESTKAENVSTDEISGCIGIEIFLSQDLSCHTREKRARHRINVVTEFIRQIRSGARDDEQLRQVSEKTSGWARNRAHELAVGYWELFDY